MKKLYLFLMMSFCWTVVLAQDDDVSLTVNSDRSAVMSNGLLTVSFNKSGQISSVKTSDGQELLAPSQVGYFSFDYRMSASGNTTYVEFAASKVQTVRESTGYAEICYTDSSTPLGWSIGYAMRGGVSGLYAYAVVSGSDDYNELHEARFVYRMDPDIFTYQWTSDDKQGTMPTPQQMRSYTEELQDATYQLDDGTIYTKYDWANFVRDDQLHGLMGDSCGAWLISPSAEWVNGAVNKQELTTHATDSSPVILQMLHSQHFGASPGTFDAAENKLFGPCLFYVNSGSRAEMIADAKERAELETDRWPYSWFHNDNFPREDQRVTVSGRIRLSGETTTTKLQVILGKPGVKPHQQACHYQFWTEAGANGLFTIPNVRPGIYALHVYALNGDALGMYSSGPYQFMDSATDLGTIIWKPTRYDKTLWEIGEADHSTAGFRYSDHLRQYGLWKSAPANTTFTIGESDPATDWYYTQALSGTWTVKFHSDETYTKPLHLLIATAGACGTSKLEVKMNANDILRTVAYSSDASVYRSATQAGRDSLIVIEVPAKQIIKGDNFLYLRLTNVPSSGQCGILYDYIRLEAGDPATGIMTVKSDDEQNAEAPYFTLQGVRTTRPQKGVFIRQGRKVVIK